MTYRHRKVDKLWKTLTCQWILYYDIIAKR